MPLPVRPGHGHPAARVRHVEQQRVVSVVGMAPQDRRLGLVGPPRVQRPQLAVFQLRHTDCDGPFLPTGYRLLDLLPLGVVFVLLRVLAHVELLVRL